MGEPSEFLDAVTSHYPDFCRRWRDLRGLGPDEVAALAPFEGEATRINDCLAGSAIDFGRRYAALPATDIPEMQRQAADVLKTAILNGFVLGVWVAQQGLAKYPAAPALPEPTREEIRENVRRHAEQARAAGNCPICGDPAHDGRCPI